MKTSFIMISALIALSHDALAQTSTATAPAASANTSVATNSSASQANKPTLGLKYSGQLVGPGMDFSGTRTSSPSAANATQDMFIDNRPRAILKINPNLDVSYEARVNTFFVGNGEGMTARSGNHRLGASIKNVYKDNLNSVTLIPRVCLPTSANAHNRDMFPSPELLINIDTSPKDSRFSFNSGIQYLHFLYGRNASKADQNAAPTAVLAPWAEVDYQATPKLAINLSYWPELDAYARQGRPLKTESNEIDLGVTYELAKGWSLSPYIAAQMNDINANAVGADKNMNLNIALSGTFL